QEPVFNLPALWIEPGQKQQAEMSGYTVVDPESVLVTHLSESLKRHAYELLSRDDVQSLVDRLRDKQPTLVNEVIGERVSIGMLQRVLQNLLRNGIAIRDLAQILEVLGDNSTRTKDIGTLTELTRKVLTRTITEQYCDAEGKIQAIVMEPSLEYELRNTISADQGQETFAVAPERAMELGRKIAEAWRTAMEAGNDKAVMLCDSRLRPHIGDMLARQLPQLPILAYDEITIGTKVDSVATVSIPALQAEEVATAG
ncbi:MAG: FHIPEP family type III secretion protein, partial [Phycisphaerae bacterium]|nr:FHIPEP family type III secretion protein [Phycisphaerae bacterium]